MDVRRWHIINALIQARGYENYLELGATGRVDNPQHNYGHVDVLHKTSVDKKGCVDYRMTTDEFFKQLSADVKYNIIFIDAQHHKECVDRDIANSLEHLEPGGVIVVHDCNPLNSRATVETIAGGWNGDVWKSIVELRCTRNHLEIYTVDADWGCAVIQRGWQEMYEEAPLYQCLTWYYFIHHRAELLNLISFDEFQRRVNVQV